MSDKLYISFYVIKGETEESSEDSWLSLKSVLEDKVTFCK